MFGGYFDQQALGLGPHLTMVGGGGTEAAYPAAGGGAPLSLPQQSSDSATMTAWGVLVALLIAGYLFFAPITL